MGYYYYDRDDNAGCFGFLAVAIIIGILAIYIGAYILALFLGLGLAIGLVFSLIIYVRSFIDATRQLRGSWTGASNSVLAVIKAVTELLYRVTVNSITETMTVVSNSFTKFLNCRVLSFQKWMWLTVVITVSVCEVIFVGCVILLEVSIALAILYIVFMVIMAVLFIELVVATVYDGVLIISDLAKNVSMYQRMDHFDFSYYATYSTLIGAWKNLIDGKREYVRSTYRDMFSRTVYLWAMSRAYKIVSIRKWFYIAASLVMCLLSHVINMVFMLLYTVAFIIIWIANAFFTTAVVLIRKVRK